MKYRFTAWEAAGLEAFYRLQIELELGISTLEAIDCNETDSTHSVSIWANRNTVAEHWVVLLKLDNEGIKITRMIIFLDTQSRTLRMDFTIQPYGTQAQSYYFIPGGVKEGFFKNLAPKARHARLRQYWTRHQP